MPAFVIVGIDPGLSGGVAVYRKNDNGEITINAYPMPVKGNITGKGQTVDTRKICELILGSDSVKPEVRLVAIELVNAAPIKSKGKKQGASSMFTFGKGAGKLDALVELMGWPVEYPHPQKWQKVVLPAAARGASKTGSISFVSRRYPNVSLLKSDRAWTPHDGMADAVCIMEYARRLLAEEAVKGEDSGGAIRSVDE